MSGCLGWEVIFVFGTGSRGPPIGIEVEFDCREVLPARLSEEAST